VNKLVQVAKSSQKSIIPPQLLEAIIQSKPENVDKMLQRYAQYPGLYLIQSKKNFKAIIQ
jgi:hypothetical protein